LTRAVRLRSRPVALGRVTAETQCEFPLHEMDPQAAGPNKLLGKELQPYEWRRHRYERRGLDFERCVKSQLYSIDGRKLCAVHAGQVALQILEREDA